jgi:hypothetical protein
LQIIILAGKFSDRSIFWRDSAGKGFGGKGFWREKVMAGKGYGGKRFWREKSFGGFVFQIIL